MSHRDYHALEFVPRQSDPDKKWVLSIKQPLAGLVAMGKAGLVLKTTPPPSELVGKVLAIHAGAGAIPYKHFTPHAKAWAERAFHAPLKDLRKALPHGGIIATARLAGAFKIGRVIDDKAYPHPGGRFSAHYAGRWRDFEFHPVFVARDPDKVIGAWAWCFEDPKLCEHTIAMRGLSGVFDLNAAYKLHLDRTRAVAIDAASDQAAGA